MKQFFSYLDYEGVKELLSLQPHFAASPNPIKTTALYYELVALIGQNFSALKIKTRERKIAIETLIASFGDID